MRTLYALAVPSLLLVGACSREAPAANDVDIANAADAARESVDNYAALPADPPPGRAASRAVDAPPPSPLPLPTPDVPSGSDQPADASVADADAAADVVRRYYALIAARRYAAAWRLWDDAGRASGMTAQAFAASFSKYDTYRAQIGTPGRIEPGAGQRYVTVPVQVSGRLRDGAAAFAMAGPVTLHRVAEIDGANPPQRLWRISASGVRPRPADDAAAPDRPARTSARYRCDDGTAFVAMFDAAADTAMLRFADGQSVTLPGQRPASGIWYRSPRYELRGKGTAATLTRGRAMPVPCNASR